MVKILKYPFGYKAALAISDDCEFLTLECLDDMIEYFNSEEKTKMGKGLGLEFAGSFFSYSSDPADEIFLFKDKLGNFKSSGFQRIINWIKKGQIDTLHSYGNFDKSGKFNRELAKKTFSALKEKSVSVPVWVNHGSDRNYQNISVKEKGGIYNEFGAVLGSDFFHLDITAEKLGIKYFSTAEFTTVNYALESNSCSFLFLKNIIKAVRLINDAGFSRVKYFPLYLRKSIIDSLNNKIIKPLTLGGIDINFFYRFRSFSRYAPTSKTFYEQISTAYLNDLIKRQGAVIIYQHLGVHRLSDGSISQNKFPYFNKETFRQLNYLSDLAVDDIWVTTTFNLLNYLNSYKHLNFSVEDSGGKIIIKIDKNNFIQNINDLKYFSFDIDQKNINDISLYFDRKIIPENRISKKNKIIAII